MDLMTLLKTRRTYRRFDQSKEISSDILNEILTAQRLASCGGNQQKLRYLVIKSPEMVEKVFPLTKWAALLPTELGTPKEGEHPTMFILVIYDSKNKYKCIDTDAGLAIGNMTLAAWNHGVGSCIMDNINRKGLQELLGLDDDIVIHSAVAFGYPVHEAKVVDAEGKDSLKYYLDDNKDYCVPKLSVDQVVTML